MHLHIRYVFISQHNYSVPGYGPGSARLSTSIRSEPPPSHSHPSARPHHPSHAPPRPGSGQFVQYQPGAKSGIALSLQAQKSSPVIGAIQEERQSPQASPHHPSNQSKPRVRWVVYDVVNGLKVESVIAATWINYWLKEWWGFRWTLSLYCGLTLCLYVCVYVFVDDVSNKHYSQIKENLSDDK